MKDTSESVGDATEQVGDSATDSSPDKKTQDAKDGVSYETYQRILREKKKASERLTTLEAELQSLKEGKMADEGKKDELIESLKKRLGESETKTRSVLQNFGMKILSGSISAEAEKMGCIDSEALMKFMNLDEIEIDDEFQVNGEQLKNSIEAVKKSKPYLFQKASPKAKTGTSPTVNVGKDGNENLKNMSPMDLMKLAIKDRHANGSGKRIQKD